MRKDYPRRIAVWSICAVLFTVLTGTLLHFTYEWSGKSAITAVFSPVNESVWEHLKMAYWPAFAWSAVTWFFWGRRSYNFLAARFTAIALMQLGIVVLFYTYTGIIGTHLLWVDIAIFIIAVITGETAGLQILKKDRLSGVVNLICLVLIILNGLLFAMFTFNTPQLALFMDSQSETYGIPGK